MIIDLKLIVEIAVAITAIAGAVGLFFRKVDKTLIIPIKENQEAIQTLMFQQRKLESWNAKQQEDISGNRECDQMLLKSVRACLDGLIQKGCNGAVTEAAADLDHYILSRLGETKSKLS